MYIPDLFLAVTRSFRPYLNAASYKHLVGLLVTRIIAIGPTTITNLSRLNGLDPYHSPWHRFLSRSGLKLWPLAFSVIGLVLERFFKPGCRVVLAVDDTACLRKGSRVFGRAKHRDGVRSSHALYIPLWGHKWVVVSIIVRLPRSSRQWALPVLVGLCRHSDQAKTRSQKHRTPSEIARLLVVIIARRYRKFKFVVVGDQGYGQHAAAKFYFLQKISLVSKFYKDAVLCGKPGQYSGVGRPRVMGKRLPKPEEVVKARTKRKHCTVGWYGGKERRVSLVSGHGFWHRNGKGLVKIKWVHVIDLDGTHRDEYLYTTDASLSDEEIVSLYTARWAIEVTFQECKGHLRLEKTKVWCEQSVLRLAPLTFLAYTLIVLSYIDLKQPPEFFFTWQGKNSLTFSDMLVALRKIIWQGMIFSEALDGHGCSEKGVLRTRLVMEGLCQVA